MVTNGTAPAAARSAIPAMLITTAAAWAAFIGWRAWTAWPRLPLDSGEDPATRAAYDAAVSSNLYNAAVLAGVGVALLIGLAVLTQRKREDLPTDLSEGAAWTGPARILLMRHAEKTGDVEDIHLSKAGVKRAERLATYIPETFGKPDFIFAAARSKRSIRSIETMQPLAAAIGTEVRFDVEDRDFPLLVDDLRTNPQYRGALIVVCWHHGKIPEIAALLGAPDGSYPRDWQDETFNLILEFDYGRNLPPAVKQIVEPF